MVLSEAAPAGPAAPRLRSEQVKQRQLVVTKRRATALLAAVTVAFVALTVWGGRSTLVGYLQATAEASMVGGLADWFAVTALFRRPLGLPIPHTAIVVERKNQFGATLGDFIQESFLTPDTIVERIRLAAVVPRMADWLARPANAAKVAGHLADGAVAFADVVNDEDVNTAMVGVVRRRAEAVALAPLAGRALRFMTADGRHYEVLDAAIRGLDRYLDEHRDDLHDRLAQESPWWLPGAVEDRLFDRLLDGARSVLREMATNRDNYLRRQLEDRLAQLAGDLETSPSLLARGESLKHELLSQPQLGDWVASLWRDLKAQLKEEAADPASELRRRLAAAVVAAGQGLRDDPVLAARVNDGVETGARYVAEHFHGEIAALVAGTISRWDAAETSRRLELLLGPDLQYIRINGTVVGAGAGLVLHVIAQVLG
jgi:uncharacterized membrane-anchored protein YjiN (DUF445 family)